MASHLHHTLPSHRTTGWSLCLAILLLLPTFSSSLAQDKVQRSKEYTQKIRPLIEKYCIDCHSGSDAMAGLALNHFDSLDSLLHERRVWGNITQRIKVRQMPPPDSDVPSDQERELLVQWLDKVLTEVDCGKTPNPGRVTMRRLNRLEYRNTVRDLLMVDYPPAKDFPGDDVGYGFDNIGDVLTLPPLLMEKYLKAAEEISQQAIVVPPSEPPFEQKINANKMATNGSINKAGNSLNFFSNGTASLEVEAPWSGEFTLRIEGWSSLHQGEPANILVEVDGKKVDEVPAIGSEQEPGETIVPIRLKQGKHKIALTFTNDEYTEAKNGKPAQDRNLYLSAATIKGRKKPPKLSASEIPKSHQAIVTVEPSKSLTPRDAAKKIFTNLASRAFRRPVTKAELARLCDLVASEFEADASWEESLQVGLQAILISPQFLFKVESPRSETEEGFGKLNSFELATRMSYFLWSSLPDEQLFRLAADKQLLKPEVMASEVKRMIEDRKANAFIENFCGQWLTLRKLDQIEPNQSMFPQWNESLKKSLRRETFTFFAGVMRDDLSILRLLDADFTYVNEELARFYGIPDVKGTEFRKVSLKGDRRMGLLTQASVLAVTSNPTRTSPVKRGRFILDNILGTPPPPAPAGVPELEKSELRGTLRERMEQHRENPACASCHQLMDPLGFAFENYDAVGKWRTGDAGGPIVTTGVLPDGTEVNNASDLIRVLRDQHTDEFVRCFTEKMMTYALGRGLEYYDRCAVDKIAAQLKKNDYRFSSLVTLIVSSDPFRLRGERGE